MEADGVNFKSIRQMKKWMKDHEKELRAENADAQPKVETVVHEGPRIGRNDPCPCGSGKKYKKCCGADK
ncbi:MAG: SEC-C domain-containing protein [Elusimicrobiaceae bacterium]|nr:SEC-C domain-containing protein [Elusimicrobiaceae bacterium]